MGEQLQASPHSAPLDHRTWAPLSPGGQQHYVQVTYLVHFNFFSIIYSGFVVLHILILRLSFLHGVLRGLIELVGGSSWSQNTCFITREDNYVEGRL